MANYSGSINPKFKSDNNLEKDGKNKKNSQQKHKNNKIS